MKNIKRIFLILILFLTSINVFAYNNKLESSEAYHYNRIHVDIKIKEKGVLEVTETRDTVFDQLRRGIYFNLSQNFRLIYKNQEIIKKFNIYDIKVLSKHGSKITRKNNIINIRLGNAKYYAQKNEKYIVSYKILTKDFNIDNDIFYYNLIGNVPTYTYKLTFKISSYKDTYFNKIKFYKGRNNYLFNNLTTKITSNSIEGEVLEPFTKSEAFTVLATFEKGYYGYPSSKNMTVSILFIVIAGFTLLIVILVHNKNGKDEEIIEQITMKIPDDLNSADIAYLYEDTTSKKAIMSLLFQLANDKYIKIEADKKKFLITKLKNYDGYDQAKIKIIKMIFYNNKESIDLKKSNSNLGKELYYGFIDIQNITSNKFKKEKELYNHNSSLIFIFSIFISILQIAYLMFCSHSVSNSIFFLSSLYLYIIIIVYNLVGAFVLERSYLTLKSKKYTIFGIILTILLSGGIYFSFISYLEQNVIPISVFDIIFVIICTIITILIPYFGKRTDYANKLFGKVKGLYTFIKYTKEDKLKLYLDQNPNLFYDILPIAFAFGLTKKWLDLFKDMDMGDIDNSYLYTYATINYLSDFNENIDNLMPSYTEYISEISSSSSDGFSGFGGGGFGGSVSEGSW